MILVYNRQDKYSDIWFYYSFKKAKHNQYHCIFVDKYNNNMQIIEHVNMGNALSTKKLKFYK